MQIELKAKLYRSFFDFFAPRQHWAYGPKTSSCLHIHAWPLPQLLAQDRFLYLNLKSAKEAYH